ncbi:MAG TPA: hypothetical protein DDW81_17370, partial [Cryomorphaceae bacterium]|nr:hypothetical protein [Cryomorphaceae bacterium]
MKPTKESIEPPLHCQFCQNRSQSAFHNLGTDELDTISKLKTCVAFRKGQVIMHEGARPQGVYCIHRGKAKL